MHNGTRPANDPHLFALVRQLVNVDVAGGPFRTMWKEGGDFWRPILKSIGIIIFGDTDGVGVLLSDLIQFAKVFKDQVHLSVCQYDGKGWKEY